MGILEKIKEIEVCSLPFAVGCARTLPWSPRVHVPQAEMAKTQKNKVQHWNLESLR